jgi:hypothetical protein
MRKDKIFEEVGIALVSKHPSMKLTFLASASPTQKIRPPQIFRYPTTTPTPISINSRYHGSPSFKRKGHISLCSPILPHSSCVVEDHPRASCRPDLQTRKEGCHSISNRCRPQRFARYRSGQGCHWYVIVSANAQSSCP